jgi:hypothetical protein
MVKGRVKRINRGLMIALIKPKATAAIKATVKSLISIPGTIRAVINKETAVINQRRKKDNISPSI